MDSKYSLLQNNNNTTKQVWQQKVHETFTGKLFVIVQVISSQLPRVIFHWLIWNCFLERSRYSQSVYPVYLTFQTTEINIKYSTKRIPADCIEFTLNTKQNNARHSQAFDTVCSSHSGFRKSV